jgi:hypothetical protein
MGKTLSAFFGTEEVTILFFMEWQNLHQCFHELLFNSKNYVLKAFYGNFSSSNIFAYS